MCLLQALGINSSEDLDPTRPLSLGTLELGVEATAEAIRILVGGDFSREVSYSAHPVLEPTYWSIYHQTNGQAEVFGFPVGHSGGLTTAIEIAIVRGIAASEIENHGMMIRGGMQITLGSFLACKKFKNVLQVIRHPLIGESLLSCQAGQVIISENIDRRLNAITLSCLKGSLRTSPLKFRFLELYRIMEACFLEDIKTKLLQNFNTYPELALQEALNAVSSEMKQMISLAKTEQDAFEACWTTLFRLKTENSFIKAIFERLQKKEEKAEREDVKVAGKWSIGAALVYQIRCAIVHAGEKRIIFESFDDGNEAIEAVLPDVERAALLLLGIAVS